MLPSLALYTKQASIMQEQDQKCGNTRNTHTIRPATTPDDILAISDLFKDYIAWLDLDLTFQDFATELASLPGKYAPPAGALLIARRDNGMPLGCVALRPTAQPEICEMKRLYVSPEGRGLGLGKKLVEEVLKAAKSMVYQKMRLDTLPKVQSAAVSLYENMGFVKIGPYYETPLEGTLFLEIDLTRWES